MKRFTLPVLGMLVVITLTASSVQAQSVTLAGANPTYSQNFDGMGTNVPNSTPSGWFGGALGSNVTNGTFTAYTTVFTNFGASTSGTNYNYGVAGANPVTDRALGSIASGTGQARVTEARFFNNTSLTITGIVVSYTGEQWRNGGNASANTLSLHVSLDGSTFTALGSSFNFVTPTVGATAAALDGNVASNRVTGIGGSVNLASVFSGPGGVTNGSPLYFRWVDLNDAGNDHGVAIDDLTINFYTIPEPSTMLLVGAGIVGMLALRRRRK